MTSRHDPQPVIVYPPRYDPTWDAETDGSDRRLPVLCLLCDADLGVRVEFGGDFTLEVGREHECEQPMPTRQQVRQ
jgi:hypothetical protein